MSTALLAVLKAVVKDGSTPVVSRPAVQPLSLAQYAAGHFLVEYVNEDGTSHSLVYDTPLHAVRLHPTDAEPAISLQGSVLDVDLDGNTADNWARFELVPGHWVGVDPRMYGHEGVLLIGGDPDDRVVVIPHSPWKTTPADSHPGDDVQVPDPQQPLAPGPQGEAGPQGPPGALPTIPTTRKVKLAGVGGELTWQQWDRVTAVFVDEDRVSVEWEDFEDRPFKPSVGAPVLAVADGGGSVAVSLQNVTSTGCDVQLSDAITGEVTIEIEEVLS